MANETIIVSDDAGKKYENPLIPRVTSDKLFNVLDLNLKRGNVVIIDWLKYRFDWGNKLYIDKNAKKSADIQWKKYKEVVDLKKLQEGEHINWRSPDIQKENFTELAQSRFDETFNSILRNSWTDLWERNRRIAIKCTDKVIIKIKRGDWKKRNGSKWNLSVFYNPNIDYKKIWIRRSIDPDEYYCLARLSSWKFELDSNDGGKRFVDDETVYNEILPVFSEYLQNK